MGFGYRSQDKDIQASISTNVIYRPFGDCTIIVTGNGHYILPDMINLYFIVPADYIKVHCG